ncbi:MAG TPA: XRE family transcriptional regulator [Bacteroidetes bacterium]|nr:XRE family transcriptional regulator [Bacteroidota bacterium]
MTDPKTIGKNLKTYRDNLGFTQEYVASYLGVERVLISYYESGTRKIPIAVLTKLSDLYGLTLKELIDVNPQQSKLNAAFAFRATNISENDMRVIAAFKRIAKNYLMMKDKLDSEEND